jgi:hypothetical protein
MKIAIRAMKASPRPRALYSGDDARLSGMLPKPLTPEKLDIIRLQLNELRSLQVSSPPDREI